MGGTNKVVAVGLSGGVDSAVAALLLQREGYKVIGVTMLIYGGNPNYNSYEIVKPGCYGPDEKEDLEAAKEVCEKLGIEHHVIDLKEKFNDEILSYFKNEYAMGRTPNPCVQCNHKMKFGFMLEELAEKKQFDHFATGHYVRMREGADGKKEILRGVDDSKDQSYFLYRLGQDVLSKVLFPVGGYKKSEIKEMAKKLGLKLEEKTESQNFASLGNETILAELGLPSGEIVDESGATLGIHNGVQYYTVGQRKGLGLAGGPWFVKSIVKSKNQIVVSDKESLLQESCLVEDCVFVSGSLPKEPFQAEVQVRYRHTAQRAIIYPTSEVEYKVVFENPQFALSPGQSAVFYRDENLLGGGTIANTNHC